MDDRPHIGTVLVARAPWRVGEAQLEPGTRLEVTDVRQWWDNTHALIVLPYEYTLQLKVLDGPHAGRQISVTESGVINTSAGPHTAEHFPYPAWLGAA